MSRGRPGGGRRGERSRGPSRDRPQGDRARDGGGDRGRARRAAGRDGGRREDARLERPAGDTLVAVVRRQERFLTAEPFFNPGPRVTLDRAARVREGGLALLRLGGPGRGGARLVKPLGRPDVARDVVEALLHDRGLRRGFERGVEREAQEAAEAPPAPDVPRADLRALPTFTIDPATARDFDDAISAEALGDDRWRVHVHIADVTAHVRPGTRVDREAMRRGTSVYVPGTVEPMLPHALSSSACSLVPLQDRLAVTVEMELHAGRIATSRFHRSLVRSDARLDYDRVDRVFAGRERAEEPWAGPLAAARAASAALAAARRGDALAVESAEPEFHFDEHGHVTGMQAVVQTESHRLVEHLMIAANEAVATYLHDGRRPALYRVHERPDPSSVDRLLAQLASLDVPTPPAPPPERMDPADAARIAAEASRLVARWADAREGRGRQAVSSLVLRAMKQARYAPESLGHAGLGLLRYCHFTSPIRRSPDVVCHRSLLAGLGLGEDPPKASGLEEAGLWASQREREAMLVERDADDVVRCFLLERRLFEEGWDRDFEGEVVGLAPGGVFVRFGDGFEGMLPVRRLRGEWWELNEEGTIMLGTESGRAVRLGDPVTVAVGRVDAPRGRVDLHPVEL